MYGRNQFAVLGNSNQLSADGLPEGKIAGLTIDWSTVTANPSDVTLPQGTVVPAGQKYLPVGTTVVLITSSVNGSTVGMYGPYDPAATDGRQTIGQGLDNYLLNRDAIATEARDQYPEAIVGGRVWSALLRNSGVGAPSLAAGPTLAALKTAFPRLILVTGN